MGSGVGADGRRRVLKVARNDVTEMKEALLAALLSPLATGKLKQRQVIQMLLPEIKALRATGVEFEEIAAVLHTKGMRLTGETLRMYYFDEKREADTEAIKREVDDRLAMVDRVMDHMADISGKGAQAVLNRVLKEASVAAAAAAKHSAGPAIEPPAPASPATPATSTAGGQSGADADGGEKPPGAMSLDDVEKMLGQEVDISKIRRRPKPGD